MKKILAAAMLATAVTGGLPACKNNFAPPDGAVNVATAPKNAPDAAPSVASSGVIAGHLAIDAELAAHVKPGDTIFLIARDAQTNAMVAVTKLAAPAQFPLPFVLSSQNAMMGHTPFQGSVKLTARVDKDGDPMSKNPGDVIGEVAGATPIPASDVVLTLNKVL